MREPIRQDIFTMIDEVVEEFRVADPDGRGLRPYQVEFLTEKVAYFKHTSTFDEMGLGKTVQCIAADAVRRKMRPKRTNKTLVVAPLTGVIDQWVTEFNKWQPQLVVRRINPKKRYDLFAEEADVYIIHPEGLRLEKEILKELEWRHFIFDECHRVKNRRAKTTEAAKEVGKSAEFRTGASGTPEENRPDELWSIFEWMYPNKATRVEADLGHWTQKLLNSYWRFYDRFIDYYEDENGYDHVKGTKNEEELRKLFGPLYIRRLKSDVAKDLPPKQYTKIEVELPPKQRRPYDEMKGQLLAWVGEKQNQPLIANIAIAQMVRLQQFTLGYGEIVPKTITRKNGDVETVNELRLQEPSVKLDAMMDLLEDLGNAQAIVFSTSKQAINMAKIRLDNAKIPTSIITGDITDAIRRKHISDFQEGKTRVLVSTIRAGGVGMNLQNASNVIFLDRDWSPAKNMQAEDRSHRMGQKNPVNIYDIIAKKTIDQKKHTTIEKKWEWIRDTIGV